MNFLPKNLIFQNDKEVKVQQTRVALTVLSPPCADESLFHWIGKG